MENLKIQCFEQTLMQEGAGLEVRLRLIRWMPGVRIAPGMGFEITLREQRNFPAF